MKLYVEDVGSLGVVTDLVSYGTKPQAWTSAANIRFYDNAVEKLKGYAAIFGTPLHASNYVKEVRFGALSYWLYLSNTAAGITDGTVHADATRSSGPYAQVDTNPWNSTNLGGIAIINNFADIPQALLSPSLSSKFIDMTAWPSTYRAKKLIEYKNTLFALNLSISGVEYPHRLLFSHPADPGSLPSSWDITDPTKDAGEVDLTDTDSGSIVTACKLGDSLMIYKENSTWRCTPTSTSFVFAFKRVFNQLGCAAPEAVIEIPRQKKNLVYTGTDLVIHDGETPKSILTEKIRQALTLTIDSTNFYKSFMVSHVSKQEIWFCYPTAGFDTPNTALIYNYETGIISTRALPSTLSIASGVVTQASYTWDSITTVWDATLTPWGAVAGSASIDKGLLLSSPTAVQLYQLDTTEQDLGVNMNVYLERSGLAISGYDRRGVPIVDTDVRKVVTRVYVNLTGGPIDVKLLSQEYLNGPVTYTEAQSFDPTIQTYVDFEEPLSGAFYGVRFESSADITWTLYGYTLNLEVTGRTQ